MGITKEKLIHINDIKEPISLISGSTTDYISPSGIIYSEYSDDLYYPKSPFCNNKNGYMYINVKFKNGKMKSRRLHVLLAKAFIYNPNPKIYKIVGHKDNDKTNNNLDNLYWTTTQENTQKAVDDGLIIYKKGENNNGSNYIKVLDKNTFEVVGVYGSLRECCRCIENITLSTISKVYKLDDYYPRSRKYIYRQISKEEYDLYPEFTKGIHLIESQPVKKNPLVFRMTNRNLRFEKIFDNQVEASKICNIPQALISKYLKENNTSLHNGWKFELIGETTRRNSSAYENHINSVDSITIKNIYDGRILQFETAQKLQEFVGLNGNNINDYIKDDNILMNEWKIIRKEKKNIDSFAKIS